MLRHSRVEVREAGRVPYPLYHATSVRSWAKIQHEGLVPSGSQGLVWLDEHLGHTARLAESFDTGDVSLTGGGCVIEVNAPLAQKSEKGTPGAWTVAETIDPMFFDLMPEAEWRAAVGIFSRLSQEL